MADKEFKAYDSTDEYSYSGARLTADADARDGKNGKMVRLSLVSTSWRQNNADSGVTELWVEANVADYFAEAASFMKKNDVLHKVSGKPYLRRFGENKERIAFCIDKAQLVIPAELKKTLKERGWSGGGQQQSSPAPAKSATKPTNKPTGRRTQRQIEDLPE